MKLITDTLRAQLLKNGQASDDSNGGVDHRPVVKLFDPCGAATWLIAEMDPNNPDALFGLCDLGMGEPELGYVSLSELEAIRGRFGLGIERDLHWSADRTIGAYLRKAQAAGRIVA